MGRTIRLVAALAILLALFFGLPRLIEARIASALRDAAVRAGVALRVQRISFSWLGHVDLVGFSVEAPERLGADAFSIRVGWRPSLGGLRHWPRSIAPHGLRLRVLPVGFEARVADAEWGLDVLSRDTVTLSRPDVDIALERGGRIAVAMSSFPLGRMVEVRKNGARVLDVGKAEGHILVQPYGHERRVSLQLLLSGLRVASVPDEEEGPGELGGATDVEVSASAMFDAHRHRAELWCGSVRASGVEASAAGAFETAPGDRWSNVLVEVPRFELAKVLAVSGLELPIGTGKVGATPDDLGTLELWARVSGHLKEPDSIAVDHRMDFRPARSIPALNYLRGPFTHTVTLPDGRSRKVEVRPESPDYVPLGEVPSLFLRALTIAEDAAFWGHPGVDLQEIPVAFATNWLRGQRARGASTITQQLVKNLFLSRDKRYGRKLQEIALALLVEGVLSKERILEIYLNVIEWGPELYGLRPAARHYFHKEPRELTPKEIVFLVSLIPGPIKYQRSIAGGSISPGFRRLMAGLLAKLRSVDTITEEEYQAAREELATYGGAPSPPSVPPAAAEPDTLPMPGDSPAVDQPAPAAAPGATPVATVPAPVIPS